MKLTKKRMRDDMPFLPIVVLSHNLMAFMCGGM